MNDEKDPTGKTGMEQPPSTPPRSPTPPPPPPSQPGTGATPPPGGAPPPFSASAAGGSIEPNQDARMWGMLAHLLSLVAGPLAALIIWQMKKDEFAFVDDQGKEALNFQICMLVIFLGLAVVSQVPVVFCLTVPLMLLLCIPWAVFTIIGGVKANQGERYRYPLTLRFVK